MTRRLTALCALGMMLVATAALGAQTGPPAVDWQALQEAWTAYISAPSEEGAAKVFSLLPAQKIADIKDSFEVVNSFFERLGILEGEIYSGNPNAVKLGFRLYTIAYGTLEAGLNRILGSLIAFKPQLFLEELQARRDLFPTLNPLLGSYLRDMANDPVAMELEKKLRIKSLESVEDKALKSLRSECIKILKKF